MAFVHPVEFERCQQPQELVIEAFREYGIFFGDYREYDPGSIDEDDVRRILKTIKTRARSGFSIKLMTNDC